MFQLTFGVRAPTIRAFANPGICAIVFVMPNNVPEYGPATSMLEFLFYIYYRFCMNTFVKNCHKPV